MPTATANVCVCVHKNEMMFHLLSIIYLFLCLYENIIGVLRDCVDVVDGRTRI